MFEVRNKIKATERIYCVGMMFWIFEKRFMKMNLLYFNKST